MQHIMGCLNFISILLLVLASQSILCFPNPGRKSNCPVAARADDARTFDARAYGGTSDRQLYNEDAENVQSDRPLIAPQRYQGLKASKFTVDYKKPDFYDPSYGFSKESMEGIGLHGLEKDTDERNSYTEVLTGPGKGFHSHVYRQYTKYPEIFPKKYPLQQAVPEDSKQAGSYVNPLKFFSSYGEQSKYDEPNFPPLREAKQSAGYGAEGAASDYEKYLREIFKEQAKYPKSSYGDDSRENFKEAPKFTKSSYGEELSDSLKYYKEKDNEEFGNAFRHLDGGDSERPYREFYDQRKNTADEQGRYIADLYEQSHTFKEYYEKLKNSGLLPGAGGNDSDEFNSLKFREGDRPRRNRRPSSEFPPGRKAIGPPARGPRGCPGGRCGGRGRRPRQ